MTINTNPPVEDFSSIISIQKALLEHSKIEKDILAITNEIASKINDIYVKISQYRANAAMLIVNTINVECSKYALLDKLPSNKDIETNHSIADRDNIYMKSLKKHIFSHMNEIQKVIKELQQTIEQTTNSVDSYENKKTERYAAVDCL